MHTPHRGCSERLRRRPLLLQTSLLAALLLGTSCASSMATAPKPTKAPVVGGHPCGGNFPLSQGTLQPGKTSCRVLVVDGMARNFLVQVPAAAATKAVPLVVMFHGTTGDGLKMLNISGWSELATKEQFAVAFPTSMSYLVLEDNRRETKWHDYSLQCDVGPRPATWPARSAYPANDTAFVDALLVDIEANMKIDTTRVYASGFSNGANFAMSLSISRADTFAAVGAWAGRAAQCTKDGVVVEPITAPHLQNPAHTAVPTAWGIGTLDDRALGPINAQLAAKGQPPLAELPLDEASLSGPTGEAFLRFGVEAQGLVWKPGTRIEMTDWAGMSWMPSLAKPQFITLQWKDPVPGNTAGNTHTFMLLDNVEHHFPNALPGNKTSIKESNGVNAAAMFWQFFARYRR